MNKTNKKKVLFIETGMGFGGSAMSLKEIVYNLERYEPITLFYAQKSDYFSQHFSGVPTTFLNLKFTYKQKGELQDFLSKITTNKIIIRFAIKLFSALSFLEDQISIKKLSTFIKSENVELMHINNRIDPIAVAAAIRCRIPCIVHSRGHEPEPAEARHIEYINHLIAPTQKIADHEHYEMGVPKNKISVLYDTIDVDYFEKNPNRDAIRRENNIDENNIVVAMFARIIPMKGQLVLAKAVHQLKEKGLPLKCMFVGDSSDYGIEYLHEIEGYISAHNLENIFIFSGYQNDTASFYAAADIIIHPSTCEEAFGRIIIEAWAARRPIVASDIGASVELIDNEKTGLLVTRGSVEELANAIERLIEGRQLTDYLVENSVQRVEAFKNDYLIEGIENLYDSALRGCQV